MSLDGERERKMALWYAGTCEKCENSLTEESICLNSSTQNKTEPDILSEGPTVANSLMEKKLALNSFTKYGKDPNSSMEEKTSPPYSLMKKKRRFGSLCSVIVFSFTCTVLFSSVLDCVVFAEASNSQISSLTAHERRRGAGIVKLAVIAPADPHHEQSLSRILPAVSLAVKAVISPKGPLPGWIITVNHRDSQCSSTYGSLAAFDFYINRTAGLFSSIIIIPFDLLSLHHSNINTQ